MKKQQVASVLGIVILGIGGLYMWSSCRHVKVLDGTVVVQPFDINKYLGTWYKIARFDFKHEKNLKNVTATYTLNDNGSVKVINRGFDYKKNKWKDAKGVAKFVDNSNKGALKVSFFGPFYAGYNIVAMEPDYKTALIFGENKNYMWILSREKSINNQVKDKFIRIATEAGYDVSRLVWTEQE
jgi:apolipoprotein D and lipocalin family protein